MLPPVFVSIIVHQCKYISSVLPMKKLQDVFRFKKFTKCYKMFGFSFLPKKTIATQLFRILPIM